MIDEPLRGGKPEPSPTISAPEQQGGTNPNSSGDGDRKRYTNEHNERDNQHEKSRRKSFKYFWLIFKPHAERVIALVTIILAIIAGIAVIFTRDALETSQRAWVAPIDIEFPNGIEAGKHLNVFIVVENPGNSAALNIRHKIRGKIIAAPINSHGQAWFGETKWPKNDTCDPTKPESGVVYPTSKTPDKFLAHTFTGEPVPESIFETVDLRKRPHDTIYFQGCINYDTFESTHESRYCIVLLPEEGKAPDEWISVGCEGNSAN